MHQFIQFSAAALLILITACGTFTQSARVPQKPGYVLTFHDEFDGTALDASKWNDCGIDFSAGAGVVGKDPFAYAPENVSVADGCLRIACSKERITCPNAGGGFSTVDYRTGQVQTKGKFRQQYGWYEARIKFPAAKSLLPGFWLMPDANIEMIGQQSADSGSGAEIDIMEYHTHWMRNEISSALWWGGYGRNRKGGNLGFSAISDARDWHVYALNWEPGRLEIYVDGARTQTYTGPGVPFSNEILILSMAAATWGKRIDDSELPGSMLVDYVRVYQKQQTNQQLGR